MSTERSTAEITNALRGWRLARMAGDPGSREELLRCAADRLEALGGFATYVNAKLDNGEPHLIPHWSGE